MNNAPISRSNDGMNRPVLHHYTDFYGLSGIVRSKSIWCTKIQHLNDSKELVDGFDNLIRACKQRSEFSAIHAELPEVTRRFGQLNLFVASFSDAADTLSQWRGYAGNSGVSVTFCFKTLRSQARSQGFQLRKCIYSDQDKKNALRDFLEQYTQEHKVTPKEHQSWNLVNKFIGIAARFKNSSFTEENEWRLISRVTSIAEKKIKTRPSAGGIFPYVEFDLKTGQTPMLTDIQPWRTNEDICIRSVIIGPHRDQDLQMNAVGTLFDSQNAFVKSISRSGIPFRVL
ncbi:MAG: DUF2971 domain-containing protein [Pseudomonadota bacterium]